MGRAWRKHRASSSAHALPCLLRYAAKRLYELCLWAVLCLTKPAFMRRPWRITPCPAVHGRAFLFFLGIILQSLSCFAIRLRRSACALPDARRLRHLRCDNIPVCCHFGRFRFIAISSLTLYIPNIFLYSIIFTENGSKTFQEVDKKI